MWLPSWQRNSNGSSARVRTLAPRFQRRRINFCPQTEALDERCLLSFSSPIATPVLQPVAMVTADVNNDGKADLIAITRADSVAVMLGEGNGKFATPTYWGANTSDTVETLAVADVNGDGKLDIVTGNVTTDQVAYPGPYCSVTVLPGDGKGDFFNAQTYSAPVVTYPGSIAVSDVNGDGQPDIILADGGSVDVLMNGGAGRYYTSQNYNTPGLGATGEYPHVAVGDVNGDNKPDILVAGGTQVDALLNTGTGTFGAAQPYDAGGAIAAMAVGDVNGDGRLDIVIANADWTYYGYHRSVSVLPGHGDGTFGAPQTYTIGGNPNSIALGDFNNDGKLDIVTTGTEMDLLLNNGDGTFGTAQKVGPAGSSVVVADFNNDGLLDIAQIDGSGTSVEVLLNGVKAKKK
jgi:hypothetical protein